MNHQPFENGLLDPQTLDPRQKQELQARLQTCADCAALAEVELALHSTRMAAPDFGFTGRFQVRLEDRKMLLRRRNILGFSLLTVVVSGILAWLASPLLVSVIHSPVNTLSSWLANIIVLWSSLQALGHVSEVLFDTLPGFVPPIVWTGILLGACGWSLVWFLSMKKFVKFPQGV